MSRRTIACGRAIPRSSCAPTSTARRNLMRGGAGGGVERIVYTSSVAALKRRGRHGAGRRDGAACARRGDRRLQAQQDAGRARGRGHDPARRAAGRHRQSDDADRSARHPADADGPHPARRGARPDPGLRRHRAELRPCRRHRRGPSAGLRARPDRRALHPGRRERAAAANCSATVADADRPARAAHQAAARAALPSGLRRRGVRASHGQGAVADRRRLAHVALPHVLHLGQGRARARLSQPRPTRKAWSTRWPGSARPVT